MEVILAGIIEQKMVELPRHGSDQHEANQINRPERRTRRCAFVFKAASLTASLGDNTAWWFQRCLGIKNMGKSPVGR